MGSQNCFVFGVGEVKETPRFFIMKKDRDLFEGLIILFFILSTVGWFWILGLIFTDLL